MLQVYLFGFVLTNVCTVF